MQLNGARFWVDVCFRMLQRACMLLGGLIWREPALPSCIVGCWGEGVGHLQHHHISVWHPCSSTCDLLDCYASDAERVGCALPFLGRNGTQDFRVAGGSL